ncbi:MAG: SufD family Fe-S cluster assembly protein [Chloroflexota bacterium]
MADSLKLPFAGEQIVRDLSKSANEPDWLRDDRLTALAAFNELPIEQNQLFTLYVDLRAAKWADIEPYGSTGEAPEVSTVVPEGAAALIEVAEDRIVARGLSDAARTGGVIIDTFANMLRDQPQLLREVIDGGKSLPDNDKLAQFARAHAVLGLFIHVPANVALEQPIVVRWSAGTPGRGLVSRSVISLGENSQATILEEQVASEAHPTQDEKQSLWWGTTEVHIGNGAHLSFAGQQDFGPSTLAIVNRHATLERDAELKWALASVGALLHKSRIDNRLVGRGSSVSQVEIGFGDGRQLFDMTSYTRHVGQDTTGDLLSKGVFLDRARGYFKGMITIDKTAKGTDSFLGEFAMLLAKSARSVTIPSLEIDQPDVRRAMHSSSVGPISEDEIFYLMSRGIPREAARKFIILGFLEPVVARIPLEQARERLRRLLDAKWPQATAQEAA